MATIKVNSFRGSVSKKVIYKRINKGEVSSRVLINCANLYCNIWKESPWNEDFWKTDEVLVEMKNQLAKRGAEGILALYERELYYYEYENHHDLFSLPERPDQDQLLVVVGFTWGYRITRSMARQISGSKLLDDVFKRKGPVYYIDELGVASEFRDKKIGWGLTTRFIENTELGSKAFLLRTDKKAEAARALYFKLGFKDLQIEDNFYPDRTYWLLEV